MARSVKPIVTQHGWVLNGTYYRSPDQAMSQVPSLLSIPPERVGANGEYDYYGLAKRVQAGLRKGFGCDVANHLYIQQRGSAILLSGNVSSRALAEAITQFILSLDGATQVELRQLQVLGTQRLAAALSV